LRQAGGRFTRTLLVPCNFPVRKLAFCLALILAAPGVHAEAPRHDDPKEWRLCRPNPLYEFYRPLSGTAEEREESPTKIYAEDFDIRDKLSYQLRGNVEILRADQRVAADLLHYDPSAEIWTANGKVQYQDSGMLMEAAQAHGEMAQERAELDALRYQLLSVRGNGEATRATNQGDHSRLEDVTYTTCDPGARHWYIKAKRIDIDQTKGMATVRHASVRLGKVPLLYLPVATFPIDERRKTGFLFPSFGVSRTRGTDIAVPYYLNLAPNYDATLNARLLSKRGFMLGGQFRYLSENHRGEVLATWLPNDREAERDRGTFTWEHRGRFTDTWQVSADVNQISDRRYFEDFGDSLTMASSSLLESTATLFGRGRYWNASLALQDWTIADPYLPSGIEPYRRLPRAQFGYEFPLWGDFSTGLRSEAVVFQHDERPDGSRVDAYPYLTYRNERAAGFLRAELGLRHTQYQLSDDFNTITHKASPTRTTPIVSVDSGLVFERPFQWGSRSMLQTLEPRLYYLRVPYRDQSTLPVFDTEELGFSWGQLFRTNRFSGADRQTDANQATAAITTRFFDEDSGRERFSASLGQIRYFEPQRVQMPGVPAQDRAGSAYVLDLDWSITDDWTLAATQQWDPTRELSQLSGLRTQYRWADAGVFNFAYRFRRDALTGASYRSVLEQVDASALIPLNDRWRLVGRWNYSLFDKSTLEAFGGVEWESCCVAVRVLARRYIRNFEGERNTSLYVELELKGLSALGRKSGEFLEHAILGYSQ
jgi:LPS-assembly protein